MSLVRQLVEMLRLSRSPTGVRPAEYFEYRLFHPDVPWDLKRTYVSEAAKRAIYGIQDHEWLGVARDKLLMYAVLEGLGLPYPSIKALYHPARTWGRTTHLRTTVDAEAFLREPTHLPLFAKPVASYFGYGGNVVRSIDQESDHLLLGDRSRLAVSEFVRSRMSAGKGGTLLQELVEPHSVLRGICGDRASTVRVMVLNGAGGAEILRATWRVPTGSNMVDNFRHGKSGNMIAAVDVGTGEVGLAYSQVGFAPVTSEVHPDTGAPIGGAVLPDWPQARDVLSRAAAALPGLRLQSWDVSLSSRGPLLIELNTHGDFDVLQYTHGSGLADRRFLQFVDAERQSIAKATAGPALGTRIRWWIGRQLDKIGYGGPRRFGR